MSNNEFLGKASNSLTALTDAYEREQLSLAHRLIELMYDPTATSDQLDEIYGEMAASDKKYIDATNEIINASVC